MSMQNFVSFNIDDLSHPINISSFTTIFLPLYALSKDKRMSFRYIDLFVFHMCQQSMLQIRYKPIR